MSLLQMTLAGAGLVLLTVLVRAVAVNVLPKRTFLVLWWIVLLRLLVPVSLPALKTEAPAEYQKPSVLGGIGGVIEGAKDFFTDVEDIVTGTARPSEPTQAPVEGEAQQGNAAGPSVFVLLWATGAVIAAGVFAVLYLRCVREFRASLPVENEFLDIWLRRHKIRRKVEVRALAGLSTPLTYGLFRPVILVPADMDWWDKKTAAYVLYHEYVHIRRLDTLTKVLMALALCLHWFNPTVWVFYLLFNRDLELACDERVLRHFGRDKRADYALTLIDLEERRVSPTPLQSFFAKNATEERIRAIMKTKRTTIFAVVMAVLIVALALTAVAVFSLEKNDKAIEPNKTEGPTILGVFRAGRVICGQEDFNQVYQNELFVTTSEYYAVLKTDTFFDDMRTSIENYNEWTGDTQKENVSPTLFTDLGFTDENILVDIDLASSDIRTLYSATDANGNVVNAWYEVNGKLWIFGKLRGSWPAPYILELDEVTEEELNQMFSKCSDPGYDQGFWQGLEISINEHKEYLEMAQKRIEEMEDKE